MKTWWSKAACLLFRSEPNPMKQVPEVRAIILCGGQSSRMGKPKSHLCYHGIPQDRHLIQLCEQMQIVPSISCNNQQQHTFQTEAEIVVDKESYSGAGPMGGLLSVMETHPHHAWLLLACDYPLFQIPDLKKLYNKFLEHNKSVCYYNEQHNMDEPLLAIYHPDDFPALKNKFKKGETSLRQFLKDSEVIRITAADPSILKSFDTDEDFRNFIPPARV